MQCGIKLRIAGNACLVLGSAGFRDMQYVGCPVLCCVLLDALH
jgi:hypothetical protein